jgi:hypothetical protein
VSARPFRTTSADEKPHRHWLKVRLNADALSVDLLVSSNCPYGHDVNDELVTILSDCVPELPRDVHIFLTSCPQMIDIYADANQTDIAIYAKAQLKAVAKWGKLRGSWPDEQLLNDFIKTAEGLFLWVSTVCKYVQLQSIQMLNSDYWYPSQGTAVKGYPLKTKWTSFT